MRPYKGIWRKRDVLPFWILQIFFIVISTVAAALLFVGASSVERQQSEIEIKSSGAFTIVYLGYEADDLVKYARIIGTITLVHGVGTLIFDIVDVILYAGGPVEYRLPMITSIAQLVWGIIYYTNRKRNGQLSNRSGQNSVRDDGSYYMVYDARDRWI
ncbi:hypothetical protein F4813DRAFT_394113 [Daldinia decipiens]|uniref:uncharacterized protein n=1 Tax=Daldinia decipiens TaxID=326647 RepID=UPI0020C2EFB9|nr:uncharacterized protein F4813DRAFT_394113 [Daldinia decipiens]KAI1652972.1 hypothetical protein F4813DRAFT_394113 [Daldinia decipiens]